VKVITCDMKGVSKKSGMGNRWNSPSCSTMPTAVPFRQVGPVAFQMPATR
jgi:hypothetical protein